MSTPAAPAAAALPQAQPPPAAQTHSPPQPDAAESLREATTGSVIEFPASGGTGTNAPVGTGTTILTSDDLFGLSSLKQIRVWRPVKFTRNQDYPKVIMDGCKFKQDSGGFALFQRTPAKYLGHYRREAIIELEKKYGKKKSRRRKN